MKLTPTYKEAKRLYDMGFAIIWLHPKSKRPIESGWTTGPRSKWPYLKETYTDKLNVGVRLGTPSKIGNRYLAVIDVDVKSEDPEHKERHRKEAYAEVKKLLAGAKCPVVNSGRGNGSRHYYCLTNEPFKTFNPAVSDEIVKCYYPSKKVSQKDKENLSEKEIKDGYRMSPAWEISLYSDGRQVVLAPSTHPDSGRLYAWAPSNYLSSAADLPLISFEDVEAVGGEARPKPGSSKRASNETKETVSFKLTDVELDWLPISSKILKGIQKGTDVVDRSGFLLPAARALLNAGLSRDEILSVLTDEKNWISSCGFEHAKTRDRARAAYWVYKYSVKKIITENSAEGMFKKIEGEVINKKLGKSEAASQTDEMEEGLDWRKELVRGGQNGEGAIKSTIQNVGLILANVVSPKFVARDVFAFRDTYTMDVPWGPKTGENLGDDDIPRIKVWIDENFRFEPKKEAIEGALTVAAINNSFDPVVDQLERLPPWDGKARIDTWLRDHFEAEGDEEYLAQVFRKWLVAMIARTYVPGTKFDWMPIFEGMQGVGKSSFGRVLCGNNYFLDWLPRLSDKDSALALQGNWIVEMGELSSLRKNEIEEVKGFLTRTVDKVRPPYGRRMIETARRCVFFGTTNNETYLKDDTGNRRFKPVKVGRLNFYALEKDREQLFAEAKYLFDNFLETEESLELTGEAKVFELKMHEDKTIIDEAHLIKEELQNFVEKELQKDEEDEQFNFSKFKLTSLFGGGGPLLKWQPNGRNIQFAIRALKMMKAKQIRVRGYNFWKIDVRK